MSLDQALLAALLSLDAECDGAPEAVPGAPRAVMAREMAADLVVELARLPRLAMRARIIVPAKEDAPEADEIGRQPLRAMIEEQVAADARRMPWPESWWERADPADVQACFDLWGYVLSHCLLSAIEEILSLPQPSGQYAYRSIERGWIGSRDFHIVCSLAGFDGAAVAEAVARDPEGVYRRLAPSRGRPPRKGAAA
jgi:hypothetical protein